MTGHWFIVKRREFIERRRTMYGSVASYGPWRTLASFPTIEPALARRSQETIGLFQAVVFHRGKIVVTSVGKQRGLPAEVR